MKNILEMDMLYGPLIKKGLEAFNGYFFKHNSYFRNKMQYVRAVYAPDDDLGNMQDYYEGSNDGESFNFKSYDPIPGNIVERATSGMMSYHLNPRDKFFALTRFGYKTEQEPNANFDKLAKQREDDIHQIMQIPSNFLAEAKFIRDKMLFGVSGKVIESEVEKITASIEQYPPEALGVGTTNGKVFDIFGVCETLTGFELAMRFGRDNPNLGVKQEMLSLSGMDRSHECRRINVKKDAFMFHMEMQSNADRTSLEHKNYMRYLNHLFKGEKDTVWLDIWYNDQGVLSVRGLPYYNIIISQWGPSHKLRGIGKGQGEKSLPLAIILAEVSDINLSGYERTFAPPYLLPNVKSLLGNDFGRDGIIYGQPAGGVPTNLSLNADVRAMIEFGEYYLQKQRDLFFLDVFELIKKSRMTTVEVDRRDRDDFRRMSLFVTQDEATNLNPTVVGLNHILHEKIGAVDKASMIALSAQYTSALSYAHKNSIFDQTDRLTASLTGLAKLELEAPSFKDFLDFVGQGRALVKSSDQMDFLLTEEESQQNMERRREMEQSEADILRGQAQGQQLQNAKLQNEALNVQPQGQQPQPGTF